MRLRRSLLFVPGTRPDRIAKAAASAADGVILDLEDAVAPGQKAQAREWVVAALRRVEFGTRERIVRVNPLESAEGLRDLEAVAPCLPDAILLPKLTTVEEVRLADAATSQLEAGAGRSPGRIRFHLLIETVAGVLGARALAQASGRTAALFYGAGDLAREVGARLRPGRLTELYALGQVLYAAREAGLDAIDSPCFELQDAEALAAHTRLGADLGYDGKAVIHPTQVEVANRAFTPTGSEIAEAERIVAAYDRVQAAGEGALSLDGQFIDAVHVVVARATLTRARLAGVV